MGDSVPLILTSHSAHQLGNSLAVLRQYAALGVRYMTLTHSCNNAFADSAGILETVKPVHGGLSPIGRTLIREMNRLGVIVDVSHVSDATARQAIELSEAPVMWSHSSVRAFNNISRNVPDELLELVRKETGRDGVAMVNFAPYFIKNGGGATIEDVADHVEHVAKVAGRDRYSTLLVLSDGSLTSPVQRRSWQRLRRRRCHATHRPRRCLEVPCSRELAFAFLPDTI